MDALKQVLSDAAYAKLEQWAALDSRSHPTLFLLELCAYVLCAVAYGISDVKLNSMDDLATFSFDGLDKAALAIGDLLQEAWPDDPAGRLLAFIESNDYRISETYAERRARVIAQGKYDLLKRLSQRIAEGKIN